MHYLAAHLFFISAYKKRNFFQLKQKKYFWHENVSARVFFGGGGLLWTACVAGAGGGGRGKGTRCWPLLLSYNPPSTSWSEDFLPSNHLVFLTSAENCISFVWAKILLVCQFLSFLIVVFLLGGIGVYLYSPLVTSLRVQWLATTEGHQTMDEVSTCTNTMVQLSCLLKPKKNIFYTIIKGTADSRVKCFCCKTTTTS